VVSQVSKCEDLHGSDMDPSLGTWGTRAIGLGVVSPSVPEHPLHFGPRLLEMVEVDSVEVSTVPVLLGVGVPVLPRVDQRTALKLTKHKVYRSGVVSLDYEIQLKG
jgi:hypothetical protein